MNDKTLLYLAAGVGLAALGYAAWLAWPQTTAAPELPPARQPDEGPAANPGAYDEWLRGEKGY